MHKTVLIILAFAALIAGVFTYFYRTAELTEPDTNQVTPAATDIGPAPGATAIRRAEVRPDFSLADTTGAMRSINEWDGKALVVNFWATWCAPCRREMPLLMELESEHSRDDIQILGVAVDFRDDVLSYLAETPVNYPVLIGEQDAIDAAEGFGVEFVGMPFTAFTDHHGNVLHVQIGEIHRPQAELIFKAINNLRAGNIDLAMARRLIAHGMAGVPDQGT